MGIGTEDESGAGVKCLLTFCNMKGQYVIIDLRNMDFMKNEEGNINYYDTMDEALTTCGMYEFEDAWVMQLIYNHKEADIWSDR